MLIIYILYLKSIAINSHTNPTQKINGRTNFKTGNPMSVEARAHEM